jgi:hypothetical protein
VGYKMTILYILKQSQENNEKRWGGVPKRE